MQFEKPHRRLKVFHLGSMSGFQRGFFVIEIVMVMMMVVVMMVMMVVMMMVMEMMAAEKHWTRHYCKGFTWVVFKAVLRQTVSLLCPFYRWDN